MILYNAAAPLKKRKFLYSMSVITYDLNQLSEIITRSTGVVNDEYLD